MKSPTSEQKVKYSYADYRQWEDDERWELIDGVPYNMAPAPSTKHQEILGNIFALFFNYLNGKPCKVYVAPFEVRLSESDRDEETYHVVQPDLSVICDRHKIDDRGCKGAPDLIVEVLSPGMSVKRDKIYKYRLYEQFQVKEYWIVDPYNEYIEVYQLKDQQYRDRQVFVRGNQFRVHIFDDFTLDVNDIFQDEGFE